MKIAILYISKNGEKISKTLKNVFDSDSKIIRTDLFQGNIIDTVKNIFNSYDLIIGIMATGILVRSIAPYIKDKTTDPGVIAIDDNGNNVISILSGHIGRANEYTAIISKIINANSVISTATDNFNKLGIDVLANKFYFDIDDKKQILKFNKGILNNKTITLHGNYDISYIDDFLKNNSDYDNNNFIISPDICSIGNILKDDGYIGNILEDDGYIDNIIDTNDCIANMDNINENNNFKIHKQIIAILKEKSKKFYIIFNPKTIVFGIGTRKGIKREDVLNAINNVCDDLEIPIDRIDRIATASIKKDEKGIIESANDLKLPLDIVDIETIRNFKCDDCSKSEFVKRKFNIDGVCEPVALIIGKKYSNNNDSKLIYKKTAFNGVTIAVAISN
ncbi:MAG: cobalamin biosynthesis protein [Methanobrevibacter sp.]|jgi:cobalt-precorrin 5A hydrolase|nr:cobalamin biosynthesis protein [Candidatus Methanoflexus mossambicus]